MTAFASMFWRIVRLLSGLSLLATAFVLLARTWWLFELFSHFRVQLIAAQMLLLLAAIVMRRRSWAMVLAIAGVVNSVPVSGYLLPTRPQSTPAAAELRFITANVLASNRDPAGLIEIVLGVEPDVLAVVEFTDHFAEALGPLEDSWPHQILVPEPGTFGIAVYSRWPLATSRVFELDGFAAIHAEIAGEHQSWHFVAVHLLPPMSTEMAATRNNQLETLAEYVSGLSGSVVVAGDFNLTPYSPYFADFTNRTGLRDALRGFGPGYTWPASMPLLGIAIDHVLVSEDIGIVNYARARDIGSDHFPVIVDMNRRPISLD